MTRGGRSMVRSMCVTSAIADGPEGGEERHLADGFPGLQEIVAPRLGGKSGRENTGPQSEHAEAADHHHRGDQPAERRDRHHVAIAGRGQRHDRPPQRRGHAAESRRLDVAFQEIYRDRAQEQHDQEDHQHAEQRAGFQHQHPAQLPQARNAGDHLDEPEHRQQPRGLRRARQAAIAAGTASTAAASISPRNDVR